MGLTAAFSSISKGVKNLIRNLNTFFKVISNLNSSLHSIKSALSGRYEHRHWYWHRNDHWYGHWRLIHAHRQRYIEWYRHWYNAMRRLQLVQINLGRRVFRHRIALGRLRLIERLTRHYLVLVLLASNCSRRL